MTQAPSTPIRCPRCGYDQRGPVETWRESCPLTGICTECGLEFRWAEVLRPDKFEPQWCVEYEPKKRRLLWAAWRTAFRSCIPWRFWSGLKMSDGIRWRRLAAYPLLLLLPVVVLYVLSQGALALYARAQVEQALVDEARGRPVAIQRLQAVTAQLATQPPTGIPGHDQQVKAQIAYYNGEIARLQAAGSAQNYIDSSWLVTTWEAIAWPFSAQSSAMIVSPGGAPLSGYVAPGELFTWASIEFRGWAPFWPYDMLMPTAWLAWGVAMTFLLPLSFLLLPLSLRKAKVRWTHLIRVTVYSLPIPMLCVLLSGLTYIIASTFALDSLMQLLEVVLQYAPWLAVALWWHAATSRYLKIPHAWLTIGALTVMCLLLLLALTAALHQELAWEILDRFGPIID